MSNVKYEIGAEWTGKKATKQAETSIVGLEKLARKAAKSFASLFAAQKLISFGKSAITAAAAEDRAFRILGNTLDNLGLSYEAANVKPFIDNLQTATNITKDELIPAFAQLVRSTGQVAESQRILTLAADVAVGTGQDLATVTAALSKAYSGNTSGLGRLGTGLTKAELSSKNFEVVFQRLTTLFAGDAATALDTTEGKIKALGIASNEATQIIGVGLIDALTTLGKNTSVSNLAEDMKSVALNTADVIRGIGLVTKGISEIPVIGPILGTAFKPNQGSILGILATLGKKQRQQLNPTFGPDASSDSMTDYTARLKAQKAAQDKLIAAQNAAAKAAKNAAVLSKGAAIFNMNSIQIQAALKGKITEEDKIRLNLLQAIEDKDVAAIDTYTKQLEKIQGINTVLNALATEFKPTDPFSAWLTSLGLSNAALQKMIELQSQVKMPGGGSSGSAGTQTPEGQGTTAKDLIPTTYPTIPDTTVPEDLSKYMAKPAPAGDYAAQLGQYLAGVGSQPVVVQIDGQTIATALAQQNASGVSSVFRGSALTVL